MGGRRRGLTLGRDRRYRLVRQVSKDAIGSVWVAVDSVVKRSVAIRVLADRLGDDERFMRNLHTAFQSVWPRLKHPNVAGAIATTDVLADWPAFVVMQGFEGKTLAQRLADGGPLERLEARRIASAVRDALTAAHGLGIVHGGLSADNVVLTDNGDVKVIDFGIPIALRATLLTEGPTVAADDLPGLERLEARMTSAIEVVATDDLALLVEQLPSARGRRAAVASAPERPRPAAPRRSAASARMVGAIRGASRRVRMPVVAAAAASIAIVAVMMIVMALPRSRDREVPRGDRSPTASAAAVEGVVVPEVTGLSAMEARALLSRAGLRVGEAEPTPGPPGLVVATDPASPEIVEEGAPVVLLVGVSPDRYADEA
jgi:serine/threonine protein kinase